VFGVVVVVVVYGLCARCGVGAFTHAGVPTVVCLCGPL
jgi:hypothetical protein